MTAPYIVPAADLLPYWPHDLVAPTDVPGVGGLSQRVGVTAFDVVEYDGFLTVRGTLAVWEELELGLPLLDGLSLILGQTGGGLTQLPFELRLGQATPLGEAGGAVEKALNLFLKGHLPPYELVLPELDVKLRVDRRHLKPMVPNVAADPLSGFHEAPADSHTEFVVRGAVAVSTETGVRIDGFDRVDLDYAQIGSTGVVIRAEDVLLRLAEDQPPPDVDPAQVDLPADWKGVFFRELSAFNLKAIWEPLPESLSLTNWYLGTGGVTGKASAVFELAPDMAGRTLALRTLQLALEQGALIQALVQVAVRLGFWDDRVLWLDVGMTNEPDLDFPDSLGIYGAVSLEQPPGAPPGTAGELVGLGLSVGSTEIARLGVTKLGLRAAPDPARAAAQDEPPDTRFADILLDGRFQVMPAAGVGDAAFGAEVRELGLQVAPSFHLLLPQGLWIEISEELLTKVAAFPLSIRRIGLGEEGDERWIGLDAKVALGGDTVGAAVKGLRVYFGGAAGVHLSFEGIEVKVERLPAYSIAGYLAMSSGPDPSGVAEGTATTFRGGVQLFFGCDVGVTIDGFVLFGTKSGMRFWYVALDAGFEPGIPIATTGVSWFGAALLLGNNVAPNKQLTGDHGDQFNWYRDWYRPGPGPFSVIHSAKWTPAADRWGLGAGVSVGSADGKAWSLKALLVALFPGPVIMLEGRLTLLSPREGHKGPPSSELIRGLVVLDFDQGEFLLALELDYRIPGSGLLLDTHAEGEIYYRSARPSQWHVAVGWYEPISRRVRATALKLFNWDAYLIVAGHEITIGERTFPGIAFAVGYRTGFDKRWKFGPVRVVAAAWFAVDVAMSVNPLYILGQVGMHGELAVKAFGFGFELGLDARLALEAPVGDDDLRFAGEIEVHIGLPWPVPDIDIDIPIAFGDASALPPPVDPLVDSASVSAGVGTLSRPLFNRESPVADPARLPLDGRVVIEFQRPMRSTWSGAPTPVSLARPDQVGEVWYRYTLTAVRVRVTPAGGGAEHDAGEELFGQWALSVGDDGGPRATSLILWGTSPYPYAGSLTWPGRRVRRTWEDVFFDHHSSYPCGDDPEEQRCIVFDGIDLGEYVPELRHQPDPSRTAVVFSAFPAGGALAGLEAKFGEVVQAPIAVIEHGGREQRRCLRFARTVALATEKEGGTAVRASLLLWGIAVDLPPTRLVTGEVEYPLEDYRLRVRARLGADVVAEETAAGTAFEIKAEELDRVELLLEPLRPVRRLKPGVSPCLVRLCFVSLAMLDQQQEVAEGRGHWRHVLDPISETLPPRPPEPRFGAHLIHEPRATYRIDLDVLTELADSAEGPWTAAGSTTETLTARVDRTPADLTPYIDLHVPGDGARPFYADYDLRITYNRQYVEAMYDVAGDPLRAELLDGMGRLVEPVAERSRTLTPGLTAETELFAERLSRSDCVSVDLTRVPGHDETVYRTRLATSTAYEVRIRGGGHAEPLHRWTFVTSRYRSFAAHAGDTVAQPWDEGLPATADVAALAAPLGGSPDRDREDDAFHEAWQQRLGLPLRTLPESPDLTLLWESPATLPAVRALALVSPEPLLTDRVALRLLAADGTDQPVGVLRSRDGTRGLLVPRIAGAPAPLPAGGWRLRLRHRLTGVAGLPDLARQGSTADEIVVLSFDVPPAPVRLVDPEA